MKTAMQEFSEWLLAYEYELPLELQVKAKECIELEKEQIIKAVEWLEQHLKELENKVFNFEVSPLESPVIREDLYKQAKAMEQEQIIKAVEDTRGNIVPRMFIKENLSGEQYYNQTYNQNKCFSCGNEKGNYALYCEFCRQ